MTCNVLWNKWNKCVLVVVASESFTNTVPAIITRRLYIKIVSFASLRILPRIYDYINNNIRVMNHNNLLIHTTFN